ncbi:MAG: Signal recognition particle receptor protein FtsY [Myxococcales bacterium]|nr:Signal recognition particle receptor protein FtsY [Myxococcales bacterium]
MSDEQQPRPPRVPLEVEVTLESDHNFFTGVAENLSEGGVFVATNHPPDVGSEVGFELVLGGERFLVMGVVRWVRGERAASAGAPAGCGVRWGHLEDGALEAIRRFITVRDTDFYEED